MRSASLKRIMFVLFLFAISGFSWNRSATAHDSEDLKIGVECASLDRTVLRMEVAKFHHDVVSIEGSDYLRIGIHGEGVVMREGAGYPELPAIYRSVQIPDEARMEVRVLRHGFYEIHDVNVLPNRGNILRCVDPASVPYTFSDLYEQDVFFPGTLATLREPYILRDVRGVVVEVFPFQYNPVTRTLRVYTHVDVEVRAAGQDTANILDRTVMAPKPDASFGALYAQQFINRAGLRVEPPTETGDLLVICHSAFMTSAQALVNWKNSININTTLVDVSVMGNNASAIKSYITNLYNSSNLAFVLLIGDSSEIATGSGGSGDSDAYYSTLTADSYPDIFVGRFSAQTSAQVDTQVQRTIEYETAGHDLSMGGWNARAMGVASDQGSGIGHYGEADNVHMDLIRDELLAYGFASVDRIYDPSGTASQVAAGLNAGRRCVNYCGHGSVTSWGSTGFSNTDVNNLTNVGMLPFIFSVACVNGDFVGNTCFAEAWLRATNNNEPSGAVACYMSTVNQSWVPPMYAEGNHGISGKYGAAERFWMETHQTLGGAWYGGSCCMMDIAGSAGVSEFMNWVIFGDPSLNLFTASPAAITMDFPEGLPSGIYPPGPEMPTTIQISEGTESYVPGSGYLYYRFSPGDSFAGVPFSAKGNDLYEAIIPNSRPGDAPEFYFVAQGSGGTGLVSPPDAPASLYSYGVGFLEVLIDDAFETNTGWTVTNQNVSTGEWERADPVGTDAQPEEDHSASGTLCYVTGASGGTIGADDLDGGPTTLTSPVIDLSGGDGTISYYLYFYHSTGGTQQPLQIDVTSNGSTWVHVTDVTDHPSWNQGSFQVSDYVTPTSQVQVRFVANDNPNDNIVEALVDDFRVERFVSDPSLWADAYAVPVSAAKEIEFSFDGGVANAGMYYLMLGTISGTTPGSPLPGGAVLPINWDAFTDLILLLLNSAAFDGFLGTLDASGSGTATLNTLGPLDPSLIGKTAHFAFTLGSPFDFQSNAIPVVFEP
ncbi:MAG: C25 family cysteine peptidase [Planctomycetota bacterium]